MVNIPFVGCDMDVAVLCMDKVLAKQVETNGVPVAKYEYLYRDTFCEKRRKTRLTASKNLCAIRCL